MDIKCEHVRLNSIRNGRLLSPGDIVIIEDWRDYKTVAGNIHDQRRKPLSKEMNSLTLIPFVCEHDRRAKEFRNYQDELIKSMCVITPVPGTSEHSLKKTNLEDYILAAETYWREEM